MSASFMNEQLDKLYRSTTDAFRRTWVAVRPETVNPQTALALHREQDLRDTYVQMILDAECLERAVERHTTALARALDQHAQHRRHMQTLLSTTHESTTNSGKMCDEEGEAVMSNFKETTAPLTASASASATSSASGGNDVSVSHASERFQAKVILGGYGFLVVVFLVISIIFASKNPNVAKNCGFSNRDWTCWLFFAHIGFLIVGAAIKIHITPGPARNDPVPRVVLGVLLFPIAFAGGVLWILGSIGPLHPPTHGDCNLRRNELWYMLRSAMAILIACELWLVYSATKAHERRLNADRREPMLSV